MLVRRVPVIFSENGPCFLVRVGDGGVGGCDDDASHASCTLGGSKNLFGASNSRVDHVIPNAVLDMRRLWGSIVNDGIDAFDGMLK